MAVVGRHLKVAAGTRTGGRQRQHVMLRHRRAGRHGGSGGQLEGEGGGEVGSCVGAAAKGEVRQQAQAGLGSHKGCTMGAGSGQAVGGGGAGVCSRRGVGGGRR